MSWPLTDRRRPASRARRRAVARAIGFHHLDSGALYRALTRVALDAGLDPDHLDVPALLAKAERRGLGLRPEGEDFVPLLDGAPAEHLIRTPEVTAAVSAVSAVPDVRDWANARMRALAEAGVPVVVDGRDIGFGGVPRGGAQDLPLRQVAGAGHAAAGPAGRAGATDDEILAEADRLKARDKADASRPVAPLVSPPDAVEIDTSRMTVRGAGRRNRLPGAGHVPPPLPLAGRGPPGYV